MMTLEEAILYCEEVAEINQSIADNTDHNNWMDIAKCEKYADEYHQVAEWLRELKQYREQPEIIRCRECKFASGDSRVCMKFGHSPIGELDFCAWAERRTDEADYRKE